LTGTGALDCDERCACSRGDAVVSAENGERIPHSRNCRAKEPSLAPTVAAAWGRAIIRAKSNAKCLSPFAVHDACRER
jgi:hypothetical protein